MDNPRPEKVAVVEEVKARLSSSDAAVLTEYRGLDVDALAELRGALRAAGGEYKVYKNTLVRFAADELDLEIRDLLTGPTAIAFVTRTPDGASGDAVTVAKALKTFARDHPALVVKGGLLGEQLLAPEQVDALADIAPREELLSRLAGGLAAPMQRFAGLLQAVPRDFAYALRNLVEAGGTAEERSDGATGDTAEEASDGATGGTAEGASDGATGGTAEEASVEASESTAEEASDGATGGTAAEEVPVPGEPAAEEEIPAPDATPAPPEETTAGEVGASGEPAAEAEIPDTAAGGEDRDGGADEAPGGPAPSDDD